MKKRASKLQSLNNNKKEKREDRAYRRDYVLFHFMLILVLAMAAAIILLLFEIFGPKAPSKSPIIPLEDDLTSPTFFIAPDNRKELNLESTND
jgi:hypothetical protein